MADHPRLDELRRRVQQDPASVSFAALAEEYRRAGLYEQAIETCHAGLQRHPAYLSARVTLGRSLLEVGEYDAAQSELDRVLRAAPENLAALRAVEEIKKRRDPPAPSNGNGAGAIDHDDPPTDAAVVSDAQAVAVADTRATVVADAAPALVPSLPSETTEKSRDEAALAGLEEFLASIQRARLESENSHN